MATPILYSWMDEGAPSFPQSTSAHDGHRALLKILKGCLVDGYGSKPGAGWTLENWDTTLDAERAAFSNGNGVLECIAIHSNSTGFVIHEKILEHGHGNTDGTGNAGGPDDPSVWSVGINSQCDYNADYTRDRTNDMLMMYSKAIAQYTTTQDLTSLQGWIVVATDKSFYCFSIYNPDAISTGYSPLSRCNLFAGAVEHSHYNRDDAGNFVVTSTAYRNRTVQSSSNNLGMIQINVLMLKNPFGSDKLATEIIQVDQFRSTNLSLNIHSPFFLHVPWMLNYLGSSNPDQQNREYVFGAMPGVRQHLYTTGDVLLNRYLTLDPNFYNAQWATFDGYSVLCIRFNSNNNSRGSFLSLNPEYWP